MPDCYSFVTVSCIGQHRVTPKYNHLNRKKDNLQLVRFKINRFRV